MKPVSAGVVVSRVNLPLVTPDYSSLARVRADESSTSELHSGWRGVDSGQNELQRPHFLRGCVHTVVINVCPKGDVCVLYTWRAVSVDGAWEQRRPAHRLQKAYMSLIQSGCKDESMPQCQKSIRCIRKYIYFHILSFLYWSANNTDSSVLF